MRRQRTLLAVLLAAFILSIVAMTPRNAVTAQAAKAAGNAGPQKTTSFTNVMATFHDYDALGTLLLLRSDDYNGYQQASYSSTEKDVSSTINSSGGWTLSFSTLAGGTVRSVYITPNVPINNSQPAGPPAGYYGSGQFLKAYSDCRDRNGNIVPFTNITTSSGNCTLGVDFVASNGIEYKLLTSTLPPPMGATCPSTGCPAAGLATVTCNVVSGGQCVSWTITPNTAAANANVANLYSYTGPKSGPWVFVGQYYNTCRIGLTNP
jgi:hypothetical protein